MRHLAAQWRSIDKSAQLVFLNLPEGVGAFIVTHEGDTPYVSIDKINVDPERRRQGLGTKAMEMICSWADANGHILSLTPDNGFGTPKTVLTRWYKTFGFVPNRNRSFEELSIGDDLIRWPAGHAKHAVARGAAIQFKQMAEGESSYKVYEDGRFIGIVTSGVGGRWDAKCNLNGKTGSNYWTRGDAVAFILRERERLLKRNASLKTTRIGPLYHGTTKAAADQILIGGFVANPDRKNVVYLTEDADLAWTYAEGAVKRRGGQPAVLKVDHVEGVSAEEVGYMDFDLAREHGADFNRGYSETIVLNPWAIHGPITLVEQSKTAASEPHYRAEHEIMLFSSLPAISAEEGQRLATGWLGQRVEVINWDPKFKTQLDTAAAAARWVTTKSYPEGIPAIIVKRWDLFDAMVCAHEAAHLIRNRGKLEGSTYGHDAEWASIYVGLVATFSKGLASQLAESFAAHHVLAMGHVGSEQLADGRKVVEGSPLYRGFRISSWKRPWPTMTKAELLAWFREYRGGRVGGSWSVDRAVAERFARTDESPYVIGVLLEGTGWTWDQAVEPNWSGQADFHDFLQGEGEIRLSSDPPEISVYIQPQYRQFTKVA